MSIDIKLHKNDLPDDLNLGNLLANRLPKFKSSGRSFL